MNVLTVAIVSYKTADLAKRCYETVVAGLNFPTQAVMVDTSDGAGSMDLSTVPAGVWCLTPGNIGYGGALNLAFAESDTPYLLALNADTEFPAEGILPLIRLMENDPTIAVIGPRQVNPQGFLVHGGIERAGDATGGRCFGEIDAGQCMEDALDVGQVSGSVMLIRREAWGRLGGMADGIKLYFEDALFCQRARDAGYRVVYSGLCTFVHHLAASPEPPEGRATLAAEGRRIFDAYQEGR